MKQNIDAAAYENNINQDVKIPSTKKKKDRNNKPEYWPTSIKEILNWLPFLYIMDFTADRIENYKQILPSFLKLFSIFNIKCWYSPGGGMRLKIQEKNSYKV